MKKIFLLTMLCGFGLAISAQEIEISSQVKLVVTSVAGAYDNVWLFESSDFTADADEDYDVTKMMNDQTSSDKVVNFYAISAWGTGKAAALAEPDLEGTKLVFVANGKDADTYTIKFSNVIGSMYQLKDLKTGTITDIVADGTYSFTQTKSTTEERFEIVKKPAEPTICHQYGNLIITGHKGAKVKVLDMADQVAIAEQTLATDDEVISLSELTSGEMYQVVVDDGEPMLIRIQ